MKPLNPGEKTMVIRTDFSDEQTWLRIRQAIEQGTPQDHESHAWFNLGQMATGQAPVEFDAYVEFLDDREYDGVSHEEFIDALIEDDNRGYCFVVDHEAIMHHDNPILIVDADKEKGIQVFRILPREVHSIDSNLWTGNLLFEEFAERVGDDGIYRGI